MTTKKTRGAPSRRVLLVGGVGRMEPQYRAAAAELGYDLVYRERRCDPTRPERPVDMVVVVQPVSSPKLREAAARLAELCEVPVVYVLSADPGAVRAGVEAGSRAGGGGAK